jgi:hypothetical protein
MAAERRVVVQRSEPEALARIFRDVQRRGEAAQRALPSATRNVAAMRCQPPSGAVSSTSTPCGRSR